MHYHCEVWFPELPADLNAAVGHAMAPHCEDWDVEPPRGIWDWWQIGGRWTGVHDRSAGNPADDPDNQEHCDICAGTGKRRGPPEIGPGAVACNGCSGKGIRTKWPTHWKRCPVDLIAVDKLPDDFLCYTLIASGRAYTDTLYKPYPEAEAGFDGKLKPKLAELGLVGGYVVTVDYHS